MIFAFDVVPTSNAWIAVVAILCFTTIVLKWMK